VCWKGRRPRGGRRNTQTGVKGKKEEKGEKRDSLREGRLPIQNDILPPVKEAGGLIARDSVVRFMYKLGNEEENAS